MEFKVIGVDFSSAPQKNKPIIIAVGVLEFSNLSLKSNKKLFVNLKSFHELESLCEFNKFLKNKQSWVGGFDLPFSMPRILIEKYSWPIYWEKFVRFYCSREREYLRGCFKAWCDSRPVGNKFAWRITDIAAGSSPAMRWTNPPVAWMMHAGLLKMLEANLFFPSHSYPFSAHNIYSKLFKKESCENFFKVALEAYPGFTARKITNKSYKSDDKKKQNLERLNSRKLILSALVKDEVEFELNFSASKKMKETIVNDGKGDFLDAVICMLQAANSILKPNFGLSKSVDPLEGWITSV